MNGLEMQQHTEECREHLRDNWRRIEDAPDLLRVDEVCRVVRFSKTKLYAMIKSGDFPAAVRLGPNSVAWRTSEVEAWLNERPRVGGDG